MFKGLGPVIFAWALFLRAFGSDNVFGGQSFMEDQMEKVAQVRAALKSSERDIWLQVDGGISDATIEIATRAGADTFVAGSAVYKSEDPAAMVRKLRSLAVSQLNNS